MKKEHRFFENLGYIALTMVLLVVVVLFSYGVVAVCNKVLNWLM